MAFYRDLSLIYIPDIRSQEEYVNGHLPTAKRFTKKKAKGWDTVEGADSLPCKQIILLYDMNSSSTALTSDAIIDAANDIWARLHGSQNQSAVCLLNGGYEKFTELYPNCKSCQNTFTKSELSRIQILPLHIPVEKENFGRIFYCSPGSVECDRAVHILADIDAHINCSVIRDKAFGFSADEEDRVYYCVLDTSMNVDDSLIASNLKELHNVCLFAESHLKSQRNVLVYGETNSTVPITVILALVIKLLNMTPEAAYHHVYLCYPMAVIDDTSKKLLAELRDRWLNDPEFQSDIPFFSDLTASKSVLFPTEYNALPKNANDSTVAGIMKTICPSLPNENVSVELGGTRSNSNKTKDDAPVLRVSPEEVRLLAAETQWKACHQERIPPIFDTFCILDKGKMEHIHTRIKRKSSLKAPVTFERKIVPEVDLRSGPFKATVAHQAHSVESVDDVLVEIHAASSD